MTEGENLAGLFEDGALRHFDVTSALQVVAQELDGVDQLLEAAMGTVRNSLKESDRKIVIA